MGRGEEDIGGIKRGVKWEELRKGSLVRKSEGIEERQ